MQNRGRPQGPRLRRKFRPRCRGRRPRRPAGLRHLFQTTRRDEHRSSGRFGTEDAGRAADSRPYGDRRQHASTVASADCDRVPFPPRGASGGSRRRTSMQNRGRPQGSRLRRKLRPRCRGRRPRRPVPRLPCRGSPQPIAWPAIFHSQQNMDMIRHDDIAGQGEPSVSFLHFPQRFCNDLSVWRETDARDVEDAVPYAETIVPA